MHISQVEIGKWYEISWVVSKFHRRRILVDGFDDRNVWGRDGNGGSHIFPMCGTFRVEQSTDPASDRWWEFWK